MHLCSFVCVQICLKHKAVPHTHTHAQLYDTDKQVALETVDILDEACEEETFLEALVIQHPQLLFLGEKGGSLLTRFFSVKRGFNLMSRFGYTKTMVERWIKVPI